MNRAFLVITAVLAVGTFTGCITQGKCQWNAYDSQGGYTVVLAARTDEGKYSNPNWANEFVGPGRTFVLERLRSRGLVADSCDILGPPSLSQGALVMLVYVAGTKSFVEQTVEGGPAHYHELIDNRKILASGYDKFP